MATIDENIAAIQKVAVDLVASNLGDGSIEKDAGPAIYALIDLIGGFCKNIETIAQYTAQPPKA